MAALIGLRQRVQEVDAEYFLLQRQVELRPLSTFLRCSATAGDLDWPAAHRAAEAAQQQELPAAVLIQAVVRGHLLRKRLHVLE